MTLCQNLQCLKLKRQSAKNERYLKFPGSQNFLYPKTTWKVTRKRVFSFIVLVFCIVISCISSEREPSSITTFNPALPHISNIIKKHCNLLRSSDRCKNVFQHLPVVAFRRSPNLRDLLVTAKIASNSSNP